MRSFFRHQRAKANIFGSKVSTWVGPPPSKSRTNELLRLQGELFADLHAGHVGLDRAEFATVIGRNFGLQVLHIEVGRAAEKVDPDDILA